MPISPTAPPSPTSSRSTSKATSWKCSQGARETVAANRPDLLVECETRHRPDGDVRPVFEFLASLGYEGSFFLGGKRRPLAEFDPARHQRIEPEENSRAAT